jgi:hypothetical protein
MINQVEKEIEKFDLKTESVEKIEKFFSENILGHSRITTDNQFEGLFRARIVTNIKEEELLKTKCIWYPNWSEIDESYHQFNRCSDKGQNFFYGSNYLGATIKELDPKHNDLVIVGIFTLINPETKLTTQYAGIETLKKNPNHNSLIKEFEFQNASDKAIEEFIASKFQDKISKEESYKYKLSIAFSNILLKNDNISCIVYPSVASNLEYANYGIKPNVIDAFFACKELYMYRVERNNNDIIIIPEKYAYKVMPDNQNPKNSTIEWKANSKEEKLFIKKYGL